MSSSDLLLCFSLALLFGAPAHAAGDATNIATSTKAVEVQLDGDTEVAKEQVVLGDVATIYAKDQHMFNALSGLVISRFPDDSRELTLPASYLEGRIREALPAGTDFALRAPSEIHFRLKKSSLSAADFTSEVLRLGRITGKIPEGVEVVVEPLSGLPELRQLAQEAIRVEPAAELSRWKGEMTFKVAPVEGAGAPAWIRTRVRWFENVWVAARALDLAQPLDPSLFVAGRAETTMLREDPLPAANAEQLAAVLRNGKLRRTLAANAPLTPSMVLRRPDAQAGSTLRVVFISEGGIRVSAEGALVAPGTVGMEARARLRSSKKTVVGKLVSENLMEVSL